MIKVRRTCLVTKSAALVLRTSPVHLADLGTIDPFRTVSTGRSGEQRRDDGFWADVFVARAAIIVRCHVPRPVRRVGTSLSGAARRNSSHGGTTSARRARSPARPMSCYSCLMRGCATRSERKCAGAGWGTSGSCSCSTRLMYELRILKQLKTQECRERF
ncbi:hypothetical protein EDB92DRAFT_1844707 [Lactarius akahatsu]|uniref:Uncharacterized protein n=1 Tax=Lactarius akahatsu TaxID=416441 RepID=A0AAD4QAC4_9AGAM|nr:hypothetical protein EDB92DRAFT_1844707 [Lactarius akahatsu]